MKKRTKSANFDGSISFETARNCFRAAITDPKGNRIVKRFKTRAEAVEWLTVIKAEVFKETYIAPSNITIGEWVLQYLEIYCKPNVKPKTIDDYCHSANFVTPISNILLQKCTASQVQLFMNNLPSIASSTKLKIYRLLKAAVKKAYGLRMINYNFMDEVVAPSVTKKEVEIYTQEEIIKILSFMKGNTYYKKYYPFVLLAVTTGMRIGELIALRYKNISNGYITVTSNIVYIKNKPLEVTPKTKSGRRKIKIDDITEAALKSIDKKVMSFDGFVFHTKNGTHYSQRNIGRMWKRVQELTNVPHRNFHVLRHTCATQLIAAGVPLPEVSKRLGHSRLSHTLNLYSHAIPEYDNTIVYKIPQIFSLAK